jgi:hypothetical protein
MYISRLAFHTMPGKTHEVEQHLLQLREMVLKAGGAHVPDLATLEAQLRDVTGSAEFHRWTQQMSGLLTQSPKREVYQLIE